MYRALRDVLAEAPETFSRQVTALSIGGSRRLLEEVGLGHAEVVEADLPQHDMRHLTAFDDETFDIVVSDQVLEHVDGDPLAAVAESFRVVKPGGLVIHTSCFLNPVHYGPKDLWRFTPYALEVAVAPHGPVIASGGWGNPLAVLMIALGLRHTPTPPAWHPIGRIARRTRSSWPILTWVVARRH
ncbi:MAG: class I SAM-dependent methyltransferase [Actinobacteria bacterium]|nr:class I SAM-dependent methyltransferase [Actinomycetota bacterium]